MDNAGLLTTLEAILTFIWGGNAYFTLVSPTGTRFTYRVYVPKKMQGKGIYWVKVLTGPQNTSDYTYIGSVSQTNGYKFKAEHIGPEATSVKAIGWMFGKLLKHEGLGAVQFWHEGRCGRCGRKLTVPESIQNGVGPECAKK